MQDMFCCCCCSSEAAQNPLSQREHLLAPASPSHSPVSSNIRNRDQVMYYTLKQRPPFRHDSTEGHWVMRQAFTGNMARCAHKYTASAVCGEKDALERQEVLHFKICHKKTNKPRLIK